MRKINALTILTLSAAALAACGQSGKEGDAAKGAEASAAAPADPDKEAAEVAFQFQPGLYRTTISVQKIEMPGAPPEIAGKIKAAMGKVQTSEHCMKPDQAAKGMAAMKEGMAKGKCTFDKFEASGGKVSSAFSCQAGEGMTMRAESNGTYSPTGSEVFIKVDSSAPAGGSMHIEQTVKSERIGDCK